MKTLSFSILSSLLLAGTAFAQPAVQASSSYVPAPRDALEIAIGGGYMQSTGDLGGGMANVTDVAGPGGGGELQIGVRITPNFSIGAYGTLSGYAAGNQLVERNHDVVGTTVGVKADWHFRPTTSVDPWVSLGGGMRWLITDDRNTNTTSLRGIDLARVQLGVDYRATKSFAIGPVIGASASMYLDKDTAMTRGYQEIDDKRVNWTFTGGLLGRFDLFGR